MDPQHSLIPFEKNLFYSIAASQERQILPENKFPERRVSSHSVRKARRDIINVDNVSDRQRVMSLAASNSCLMDTKEDYSNFSCNSNMWFVEVCVGSFLMR